MKIHICLLIAVSVLLNACSTIRTVNDYDPDYDFSTLKTFSWIDNPNVQQRSMLTVKHFKKTMEQKLAERGMTKTESEPDFKIAFHGKVEQKIDVVNWGYRYPGWYTPYGNVDVYQYDEGTIIVDFIDTQTNELIYRSTVSAEVGRYTDIEKRKSRIEEAVDKILENFPPKNAK